MPNKTFQAMKADVATYCKLPSDTEVLAIAGSGINDAVDALVNSRNWSWQLNTYAFQLYATSGTYAVPTDFRQERQLNLLNSAGEVAQRVGYDDPKTFDTRYQHGTSDTVGTGTPDHFTITDPYPSGMIRFDRTPDSGTVGTYPSGQLVYYQRQATLSSTTDQLSVPPEVESMVMWYAKSYTAAIFAHDQVAYAESRWQPLWRQIKRNESDKRDWRLG